jgi:hypothetical protein
MPGGWLSMKPAIYAQFGPNLDTPEKKLCLRGLTLRLSINTIKFIEVIDTSKGE